MIARHVSSMVLGGLCAGLLAWVAGCGSGGGGGDDGQGTATTGTATIQGHVRQVQVTQRSGESPPSMLAQMQQWLTIFHTQHAEANTGLAGIRVTAKQHGESVDEALTDSAGWFAVTISGGETTLVFTTDTFTVEMQVSAPADSVVSIVVTLHPDHVIVDKDDIVLDPIACARDSVDIMKPADRGVIIDGEGGVCIQATGSCEVNIDPADVTLTNCSTCIEAAGTAMVHVAAPGSLVCEASDDGIRTANTAHVNLKAGADLTITADDTGIRAIGASSVDIVSADDCTVVGGDNAVDTEDAAVIDLSENCLLISGTDPDPDDPRVVRLGPLRCEGNRRVTVTEDAATTLIIEGDGKTCVRTEGTCELTLHAGAIAFTDCAHCVRAEGTSVVQSTAERTLSCKASDDGVRAEGTADVTMEAQDSVSIKAEDDGIRAEGNATVTLASQSSFRSSPSTLVCTVQGGDQDIHREGAAIVDVDDCDTFNP